MKVTTVPPLLLENTTVSGDPLMQDAFIAWAGGVLGITGGALIVFVLILICIAILLGCVLCGCICRLCCGKQKKYKAAYQKMPSLYVDQLPGHDGKSGTLGSLEYSLEYNMKSSTLKVGVIQVMDLFINTATDQMDPYVKVTVETDDPVDKPKPKIKEKPVVFKTEIKHDCLSACFNENFSFNVPYEKLKLSRVKMIVYDFDPISKDSVVGGLSVGLETLPMENYVGKTYEATGYISPSDGADDEPGQLCVVLTHLPQEDALHVNVLEARQLDLPLHHGKRYPETAVSVTLHIGNKKLANKKTDYKGNTTNPYYGQTLIFPTKREKLMAADLTLSIKYKSHGGVLKTFGKVFLGTTVNEASNQKQWHEMLQNPRRPVAMWHSIIVKGSA